MYIQRIVLENIRGFGDGERRVDLDLRRPDGSYAGWTVVAGPNGSGKTTLLKAAALAVNPHAVQSLRPSFQGWVRLGQQSGRVDVFLEPDNAVDIYYHASEKTTPIWAGLELFRSKLKPDSGPFLIKSSHPPKQTWRSLSLNNELHSAWQLAHDIDAEFNIVGELPSGPWARELQGWFLAGYGPYRRLTGHSVAAMELMSAPPHLSRLASLFKADASLLESIQWLRELHLWQLEKRPGAEERLNGVLGLLNDGLLPHGTKVLKVDSDGLWVERRGLPEPLNLMDTSDGYQNVSALVVDLCRQLHLTYQDKFELRQQGDTWRVLSPGVVLIDEAELHLHPSWQRKLGFWLKEHFPRIQFIVTTHSPFICQAADPKGLIRLPGPGEDRKAEHVSEEVYKTVVNGTLDEAVLTELFGLEHVHSDRSEQLRERVAELEARLMDGKATPEEEQELDRLTAQLPSTGSALVDRTLRKFGLNS